MLSVLKTIVYGEASAEADQGAGLLPSAQTDGWITTIKLYQA